MSNQKQETQRGAQSPTRSAIHALIAIAALTGCHGEAYERMQAYQHSIQEGDLVASEEAAKTEETLRETAKTEETLEEGMENVRTLISELERVLKEVEEMESARRRDSDQAFENVNELFKNAGDWPNSNLDEEREKENTRREEWDEELKKTKERLEASKKWLRDAEESE